MKKTAHLPAWGRVVLSLMAAATLAACSSNSATKFAQPDDAFAGQVRVTGASAVYPGSAVTISGANFKPGQQVELLHEGQSIAGKPVTANEKGEVSFQTHIPKDAKPGRHPVVVSASHPSGASIFPLKISPNVALSGAERFNIQREKLVPGLYQSAYSQKNNTVFVTAAVGRPPVARSEIVKLNGDNLSVIQRVSPPEAPARKDNEGKEQPGGLFAVYGVAVDDANDTIWVTNTRQNTVSVYAQSDLRVLKQFAPGAASHSRDVVIDTKNGKAYVTAAMSPNVEVFDTKTMEKVKTIELKTTIRRPDVRGFSTMSLAFDAPSSKLFVVSATNEVAVINTNSDAVEKVFAVKGAFGGAGVAYDASTNRLFVASQGSDNVIIVDATSGDVLHSVLVGAGTLNVAFDPVSKLAYASNRGSGTVTVLDSNGKIVANLEAAPQPNHVAVGRNGVVYAVNKGGDQDANSNTIIRIQPK